MKNKVWHSKKIIGITAIFLLIAICLCWQKYRKLQIVFSAWDSPHTLVIDAGHGGFDGGAVGADGTTEQHINLSIAKQVEALVGFFGVPTVMTRNDEEALEYEAGRSVRQNKVADIKERARIAESTENAVFLSIHLNKFPDPQYWGAQVFYSANNPAGKPLAQHIQKNLIEGLSNGNNRQEKQAANTIYLMKRLQCPAIIVECGFLSNPEEEEKLKDLEYQKQIAVCICAGYLQNAGVTVKENV